MRDVDIIVLGDGIVARATALGAQVLGLNAVRVARPEPTYENDPRSYAIAPSSLRFLSALGVDFDNAARTEVDQIQIAFGDHFSEDRHSFQKPSGAMMHMIDHRDLAQKIGEKIATPVLEGQPNQFDMQDNFAYLPEHNLRAPLMIVAEGKHSTSAKTLGISFGTKPYEQIAITAKFKSSIPHQNIARQLFTMQGPLGILPHATDEFSIVWSQDEPFAQYLMGLSDTDFVTHLEGLIGGVYGKLKMSVKRSSFPLSHVQPTRLTGPRFALVGDCAHAIHPLAGQGLNLGLRDVASLLELLVKQKRLGLDIGNPDTISTYASWRKGDIAKLSLVTKSLQKFGSSAAPALGLIAKLSGGSDSAIFQKLAEISDAPLSPQPAFLDGQKP